MPLDWIGWIASVCVMAYLTGATYWDVRMRRVPSSAWQIVPFFFAVMYREIMVIMGDPGFEIVLCALLVVLASERKRFAPWFSWLVIIITGASMAACLITTSGLAFVGVISIIVWFLSWEQGWLGGADAIALIVCTLVWPGFLWLALFAFTALIWSFVMRLLQGGWLRGHPSPAVGMVLMTSALYLLAQPILAAAGLMT